ncbi:MAG: amidohydrolase family protein [Polyangiaceae bacterium]|nr:amidohydrolase family protein [Polyangiaceae bacterium]
MPKNTPASPAKKAAPKAPKAPKAPSASKARPIMDTHIHLYQVTRPGGVPWPSKKQKLLYRDITPAAYKELAAAHGIVGCGIVEASPLHQDNFWVLDQIKGDTFFPFLVAQLEVGSPDFARNLAELKKDKRVVGVRCFLWSPTLTLDETQLAHVREIEKAGLVMDLVSRNTLNPKALVSKLAAAAPKLRIVLDHLAGAKGAEPDAEWELNMRRLADLHPNIFVKFSSFFDMYSTAPAEDKTWKSPANLSAYQAHFDVLLSAFGPQRLIWGSNWPVSDLGGSFGEQIRLAEEFLAPHGTAVRDQVMYKNAKATYRRGNAKK